MSKILTMQEMLAALSDRDCALTADEYKRFILAVATVPHQGTEPIPPQQDLTGQWRPQFDSQTGKQVERDKPYLEHDAKLQHAMATTLTHHLKLCHAANRWVLE